MAKQYAEIPSRIAERFARMADEAVMDFEDLSALTKIPVGSLQQMRHRGELPPKAFPNRRVVCWFVRDIRTWLKSQSQGRGWEVSQVVEPPRAKRRSGRPRHSPDVSVAA